MGKKNRRKKGDKKERKERLEERRERLHEIVDRPDDELDDDEEEDECSRIHTLMVGDRVWFVNEEGEWTRGVLKATSPSYVVLDFDKQDSDDLYYTLPPFKAEEDLEQLIVRDFNECTLRFDVGDRVLCCVDGGWVLARVWKLWPFYRKDGIWTVPCYQCKRDGTMTSTFVVPYDSDEYIRKLPTVFRFSVGDEVIFASTVAEGVTNKLLNVPWIQGKITSVDVTSRRNFYAVYECSYADGNKQKSCYILKDDDEHVTSPSITPRERLFASFGQCCSYNHIDYLVKSSNMDVMAFRDLLVSKAIESASYDALLWLQENAGVDLQLMRDSQNNGLLHMIAKSPRAERFFERAADIEWDQRRDVPSIKLNGFSRDGLLISQVNHHGRNFLHELIISGNIRALDLALSRIHGLGWLLSSYLLISPPFENDESLSDMHVMTRDKRGLNLKDTARLLGRYSAEKMVDEFADFHTLYSLCMILDSLDRPKIEKVDFADENTFVKFGADTPSSVARRLVRFYNERHRKLQMPGNRKGYQESTDEVVALLARMGLLSPLSWLIEEEPSLLYVGGDASRAPIDRQLNRNEFSQLSTGHNVVDYKIDNSVNDLVGLASIGQTFISSSDEIGDQHLGYYYTILGDFRGDFKFSSRNFSLAAFLSEIIGGLKSDYYVGSMLKRKLHFLQDDETLQGRLKVLDYLVKEKSLAPPNVLAAIRWRQCGVLRWLVDSSFVDLQEPASQDPNLIRYGNDLLFLGGRKIPNSMTVGEFLCLAATEFDDLQSLQWLVEVKNVPLSSIRFDGMNVLHLCGYFGRAEIVLWLTQSGANLEPFAKEECTRNPWTGDFAAHIAVKQDFTFLTELLLSIGCPIANGSGETTVMQCAKRSQIESVRIWGTKKDKPLQVEKDIQKLLHLLSLCDGSQEDVKQHILQSECMDWSRLWTDCDYDTVDDPGPLGKTYREILDACSELNDPSFVCWLCKVLTPIDHGDYTLTSYSWRYFWKQQNPRQTTRDGAISLELTALQSFASENNYQVLSRALAYSWVRDVKCDDPWEKNPLLRYFMNKFQDESSMSRALLQLRNDFLLVDALGCVKEKAIVEIRRLLQTGAHKGQVRDTVQLTLDVATANGESFEDWQLISSTGTINLEAYLKDCGSDKAHPLNNMIEWWRESDRTLEQVYVVLAIEGRSELISWLRSDGRSNWNPRIEAEVIRIAVYLGHTDVVDIFFRNRNAFDEDLLPTSDAYKAAALGAAQAGDLYSLAFYFNECTKFGSFTDPIVDYTEMNENGEFTRRLTALKASLVGSVVFAFLESTTSQAPLFILKWILTNGIARGKDILRAISFVLDYRYELSHFERCVELFHFLSSDQNVNVLSCKDTINKISEIFLKYGNGEEAMSLKWIKTISSLGFDVQDVVLVRYYARAHYAEIEKSLVAIQAEQLRVWSQFDLVKEGRPLDEIIQAVSYGDIDLSIRYRDGFLFSHLAAAYDRLDILQWLVEKKGMSLNAVDAKDRTVLGVANASNSVAVADWIALSTSGNVIAAFVSSNYRRKRALETKRMLLCCIRRIQAWQRGNFARRGHRGRLVHRLGELQCFHAMWDGPISKAEDLSLSDRSWNELKQEEHDIMRSVVDITNVDEGMQETTRKLDKATSRALSEIPLSAENVHDVGVEVPDRDKESTPMSAPAWNSDSLMSSSLKDVKDEVIEGLAGGKEPAPMSAPEWNSDSSVDVKFTSDVVKWLRHGDGKYRDFFVRRMKQLASGDRSRILAKRLTGSKTVIYETYLEQKSGHRILWTENADKSLLIWFVAKHKNVSRLMELIDDAESRSSRQLTSASLSLPELQCDTKSCIDDDDDDSKLDYIMLDPLGDTPLKLYEVHANDLGKLIDPTWKPRLYLTAREREVVEARGTVLLLGRSGTGKTCVIGNRMDSDRQLAGDDTAFSQLFIARSKGLCDYVKEAVDGDRHEGMKFNTFAEVVTSLESTLPLPDDGDNTNGSRVFLPSMKMDFSRFKQDFYSSDSLCADGNGIDALVAWTNIRSFIKGSIEALRHPDHVLAESDYLSLGNKRCRLSQEQRQSVYATFQRYDKYMKELGLWDDCDRITALALRLEYACASDSLEYQEVKYNKLYVDEVQDYTQAEIAVFFYLCGPGDLFLAGDPAQSVVEGVEFRFEEIRSVGYHLYGEDRRHLIPDKPKTVHVNFRSHCGILNVAAAVLSCLFEAFPDSAKQLKEDRGLFQGPRPGVFHKVDTCRLGQLVSKRDGIVVLTHDRNVPKWRRTLKNYPLVYGIREAKGLEFREVILVDFFVGIPAALQKLWRNLLLGRDVADIGCRPEIEGHLKLLYTAVTRCIQRLFFAETSPSLAGDAFVRWLTTTTTTRSLESRKGKDALAVKNNVENVETMVRTPDEWRSAGLDNAVMAESSHELSESETWLDRALYCFEQVGESKLASRARTHRSSIRFRMSLAVQGNLNNVDATQIEVDAAILVEQLLSEQLFSESSNVCREIMPLLGARSQELLESRLLSKLALEK